MPGTIGCGDAMKLRQVIATCLSVFFVAFVSAPAFAGMLENVMDEDSCCCASASSDRPEALEGPECECPSCGCTVGALDSTHPFETVTSQSPPNIVALSQAHVWYESTSDAHTEVSSIAPRGPPGHAGAALYILYDSLLI